MADYVWVKDNGTGHQFPMRRDEAEAIEGGIRIDEKHPTHDAGGELLHPVYKTTVNEAAESKSGQAATKEK